MPSKKPRARTTLSEEQKREVIDLAVAAGIRAYRSEATKHQKEIYDKRLHNTKLLMRNYRSLKEHSENAVFDAATAEDDDVNEILNLMSEWAKEEDTTIESIKKSAAKTKLIMDHVDEMLRIYKAACEHPGGAGGPAWGGAEDRLPGPPGCPRTADGPDLRGRRGPPQQMTKIRHLPVTLPMV